MGEVYLRLEKRRTVTWKNREQFFGFLAQLIRRILVDHARAHRRAKRGDGERPISLDDVFGLTEVRHPELVAPTSDSRENRTGSRALSHAAIELVFLASGLG